MEPFGASRDEVKEANPLKEMVGTRRLELLTSTVSTAGTAKVRGSRIRHRILWVGLWVGKLGWKIRPLRHADSKAEVSLLLLRAALP
jgi:hypothetical protein